MPRKIFFFFLLLGFVLSAVSIHPAQSTPSWGNIGSRGTASNKTSASSISVNPNASVSVGDVLMVIVASDNIGTTDGDLGDITSVVDTKANTYSKARQFTNGQGNPNAGATVGIYYSKITTALTTSDSVTANFASAVSAKAIALHEFSVGGSVSVAGSATQAGDGATAVSMTISGLTNNEYLFIGGVAVEGPNTDTFTQDTDYTALGGVGTSGGTAASNIMQRGGLRIYTGTGDTYNPTLGTARDFAGAFVALKEVQAYQYSGSALLPLYEDSTKQKSLSRSKSDFLSLLETSTRQFVLSKLQSDLLNLYSAFTKQRGVIQAFAEKLNLYEIGSFLKSIVKSISDVLSLSTTFSKLMSLARDVSDSLFLLASAVRSISISKTVADLLTLSSQTAFSFGVVRSQSDRLNLYSSISKQMGVSRSDEDKLNLYSTPSKQIALGLSQSAKLLLSTSILKQTGKSFIESDFLNLLSSTAKQISLSFTKLDKLTLYSISSRQITLSFLRADTLSLYAFAQRIGVQAFQFYPSDFLKLYYSLSQSWSPYTPPPPPPQEVGPIFIPKIKFATLQAQIFDLFNMKAANLEVHVIDEKGKTISTLTTDAEGKTPPIELKTGTYIIDVYYQGKLQYSKTVKLDEDTTLTIQIGIPIIITFTHIFIGFVTVIGITLLITIKRRRR